ncbi:hypothetical protein [Streptomyces piniterrae]|uniref:hypothetical protein n=1 Tax=Streptomyces piniterrae TaxID=2571125 RepID=UPI00145D9FD2|nr:hypothetical protein [Streptomyces piniterrae]
MGANHYVHHHRNPIGPALIVLTPVIAGAVIFGLWSSSRWSDGALSDVVHEAARP